MSKYQQASLPLCIATWVLQQPEPLPAAAKWAVETEVEGRGQDEDRYFTFEDHSVLGFRASGEPFNLKAEWDFKGDGYGQPGDEWVRPAMGKAALNPLHGA